MKKVIGFLIVICSLFCTSAYAKQIIDADIEADTYVQGGNYKANNFGSDTVICAKRETSNGVSGNTDRRAYMKINLSKYRDALGSAERITVSATTVDTAEGFVYATDWTDWQEDTFTMNDEPYSAYADIESGYTYIGAVTAAKNKRISIDVTAYAKSLLENNKTEFTLVFIGDNNSNVTKRTNLRIYSRESSYVPKITMEFSAAACLESCARQSDSIKAVYSYVNPEAENKKISAIVAGYTLKNGEKTLSGIKYREYSTDNVCGKITVSEDISGIEADEWVCMLWSDMAPMCKAAKIENISKLEVLTPEADSYTISASSSNYGAENVLYCGKSGSALRKSYLMFDLSSLEGANISDAYLIMKVKASAKTDGTSIYANEAASTWTESGINADSAPESGGRIAVSRMLKGMTCSFDFTDYIKTQLSANKGKITVVISDNGLSGLTTFASREDEDNTPKLVISYGDSFCYPKAENSEFNYNDTDPIENAKAMTAKSKAVYGSDISYSTSVDDSDYTERVSAKKLVSQSYYTSYKTRTLESLSGFDASDSTEDLCEYGGLKRKTHKATGYYYISKQGERSCLVDPCGHMMLLLGLDSVSSSSVSANALSQKYTSKSDWANQTSDYIYNRLFLNSAVNWTAFDQDLLAADNPPGMMLVIGVLTNYAKRYGLATPQSGHEGFKNNNCMPVFDPYFDVFANNNIHGNINKYRTNNNIIGFFSDNELPNDKNMLLEYLMLDPSNPYNAYSHAAAWEWLSERTGKTRPSVSDVTEELNDDFYDFVYDRYYQVVEAKYRKYAPNHLYFGQRMQSYDNSVRPGIIRAAGRYADAIAFNYYGVWTPNTNIMNKWHEWTDKPFIISEWYAKGEDSAYQTSADSGAGFICKTQSDRGKFYQNFAMKLVENPNCIGYVWFGYADTQATNKGVVSPQIEEYSEFAKRAARLDKNIYRLSEFFGE